MHSWGRAHFQRSAQAVNEAVRWWRKLQKEQIDDYASVASLNKIGQRRNNNNFQTVTTKALQEMMGISEPALKNGLLKSISQAGPSTTLKREYNLSALLIARVSPKTATNLGLVTTHDITVLHHIGDHYFRVGYQLKHGTTTLKNMSHGHHGWRRTTIPNKR